VREFQSIEEKMATMDIVDAAEPTMEGLVNVAEAMSGGHLTVMRFTTNWRVGFTTPQSWGDVQQLCPGRTFEEAAQQALWGLKDALYCGRSRRA
jgi:hypothetical protein